VNTLAYYLNVNREPIQYHIAKESPKDYLTINLKVMGGISKTTEGSIKHIMSEWMEFHYLDKKRYEDEKHQSTLKAKLPKKIKGK